MFHVNLVPDTFSSHRDAFFRILLTVLNRPLTHSQFNRLMERLDMRSKQVISFSEFYATFRDVPQSADYPRWMDPIHRGPAQGPMTAAQVHMHLKAKAQQRQVFHPSLY